MGVTKLRIIDIGINASFEHRVIACWIGGFLSSCLRVMNIGEGRDVAQIENEIVAELDGLLHELFLGHHRFRDSIPGSPETVPFRERWDWSSRILNCMGGEIDACRGQEMEMIISRTVAESHLMYQLC